MALGSFSPVICSYDQEPAVAVSLPYFLFLALSWGLD